MAIKDRFIPKEEFMRLLFTKIDGVNTHELSMWLKSQTDDEWVVVPRDFVVSIINFFENEFKEFGITDKLGQNQFLYEIKKYL
jgi:hypothetical protein